MTAKGRNDSLLHIKGLDMTMVVMILSYKQQAQKLHIKDRGDHFLHILGQEMTAEGRNDPLLHIKGLEMTTEGGGDLHPVFAGPIQNVTVNLGREAVLECHVKNLKQYKVRRGQAIQI